MVRLVDALTLSESKINHERCCTKKINGRGFEDRDESDEFLVQIFSVQGVVRSEMETVQKKTVFLDTATRYQACSEAGLVSNPEFPS
jgi:hypothetical protein